MKNTEYQIPGPSDGQLRFKTEQEFIAEFGERWYYTAAPGWYLGGGKDYLFGLPVKEEWVGKVQAMHPDECPHGDAEWYCYPEQLTRHPLPDAEPAKPREHWVGQEGTLPDGTKVEIEEIDGRGNLNITQIWIIPHDTRWDHKTLYQSITWDWNKPEPSIYERFQIGKKFMLEVEVEEHDPYDSAYPLRVKTPSMQTGLFIPAEDLPKD